jgi:hypothetical protein
MAKIIRHVVTEMDDEMIQRCVICGEIICDYSRGVMYPATQEPPKGWAAGDLYIQGKNPTVYSTTIGDDEDFEDCKP